jgi:hypothetical protein
MGYRSQPVTDILEGSGRLEAPAFPVIVQSLLGEPVIARRRAFLPSTTSGSSSGPEVTASALQGSGPKRFHHPPPPRLRPGREIAPACSTVSSSRTCAGLSLHGPPPGPFDAKAARPPAASAHRHRFADIRDTRNRPATSRSLASLVQSKASLRPGQCCYGLHPEQVGKTFLTLVSATYQGADSGLL